MNRCVLDSVLWFHLECPKRASQFDDPLEFKRKWRDFFSQNKSIAEAFKSQSKTQRKMQKMYGYQSSYPEDFQVNTKVKKFEDEFEKYNPNLTLLADDEEEGPENPLDAEIPLKDAVYGKKIERLQMNPIKLTDSNVGMGNVFDNKAAGKEE